jgi:hypothetical protein
MFDFGAMSCSLTWDGRSAQYSQRFTRDLLVQNFANSERFDFAVALATEVIDFEKYVAG